MSYNRFKIDTSRGMIVFLLIFPFYVNAQKGIAITIDDVPNTKNYIRNNKQNILFQNLDSLNVPYTIFVNEGLLYKNGSIEDNLDLLTQWCSDEQVTVGNHTYSHSRYSDVGLEKFTSDILKGQEHIFKYMKDSIRFFRFPYNDLGKDSLQHTQINQVLDSLKYYSTPFTVESSDWMFNAVYLHYLDQEDTVKANEIGNLYVMKTIELLHFYDSLSLNQYKRSTHQIYLCHDNALNQKYLPRIIELFKKNSYKIISLQEALTDPVFKQKDIYYKKWGISCFYRWMSTQKDRYQWMKLEPDFSEIETEFEKITKHNKKYK